MADGDDPDHDAADERLANHAGQLQVPAPVVVETAWLIEARLGPATEAEFLRSITTTDEITVEDLTTDDWTRVVELVDRYADLPLGLVDASVIALAERTPGSPPSTTATSPSSGPATSMPSSCASPGRETSPHPPHRLRRRHGTQTGPPPAPMPAHEGSTGPPPFVLAG